MSLALGARGLLLLGTVWISPAVKEGHRAPAREHIGVTSDSSDVVATVARFHAALAAGDSSAALGLLAPDVQILESGEMQALAQYREHHLPADIAYARAVPSERTVSSVVVVGNAAWVAASSTTVGTFNGRAVNSAGAELVVLSRAAATAPWRIRAVHWSSRRR